MNIISLIIEAVSGALGGNIGKLHCWNCRGRTGGDTSSERIGSCGGWRWHPGYDHHAKQRRRWRRRRSHSLGHHRPHKERRGEKVTMRPAFHSVRSATRFSFSCALQDHRAPERIALRSYIRSPTKLSKLLPEFFSR